VGYTGRVNFWREARQIMTRDEYQLPPPIRPRNRWAWMVYVFLFIVILACFAYLAG